jgi:hypothetical protein
MVSQSICECSIDWLDWVTSGVSLAPRVLWGWLVKLKMLWPTSLLIVLALLTVPNGRPASFLFFEAAVDHPKDIVKIRNKPIKEGFKV